MIPRTTKDIAWLGGLLEGEGAFMDSGGSVTIKLAMCDEDTVARAAGILGVQPRKSYRPTTGGKAVYECYALGVRAMGWMMTLYQFLGARRQQRVREIIAARLAKNYAPRAPRGQRFMATCHPDRPRRAWGPCNTCGMREYRHRTGKHTKYYRTRNKKPVPLV